MPELTQAQALQQRITDEIFLALGLSKKGRLRRMFGWLFDLPTRRFSRLFSEADDEIGRTGLSGGCGILLPGFSIHLEQRGAENLPAEGPLLVVSNHPGAYDSICIGSCIPRRDLKIVVWEIPFYRALTNANRWFIYATDEPTGRMLALRECITHLKKGGSVLIFGTGVIEPDPACSAGAEKPIAEWSPSIEVMLSKAPETRLAIAMASGVLSPKFLNSPLTRLRKEAVDRRRLAEFVQIISQMVFPRIVEPHVRLSFDRPALPAELAGGSGSERLLPLIKARAGRLLEEHVHFWYPERGLVGAREKNEQDIQDFQDKRMNDKI